LHICSPILCVILIPNRLGNASRHMHMCNSHVPRLLIWSHVWCQVDRGQTHKGAVPDEESCSPFLYYQSQQLEARVLAKQRPLRLPSVYLMAPLWPNLPHLPLRICILQAIKDWRWERPGNEATCVLGIYCPCESVLGIYSPCGSVWWVSILCVHLSYIFVYHTDQHMAGWCDTWHLLFQRPTCSGSNLATPTITEDHCAAGLTGTLAFGILVARG